MATKKPGRVREQVVVYLDERDRALLEEISQKTGLPRTELFLRGLRRVAEDVLGEQKPGGSLRYLIATAGEHDAPADVAARHDDYLYGGGYKKRATRKSKRARPR